MKKNKTGKLAIVLIIIILFNVFFPINYTLATTDEEIVKKREEADENSNTKSALAKDLDKTDGAGTVILGDVVDGIVGILTWIPRAIFGVVLMVIDWILDLIFPLNEPEDILFNRSKFYS